MTAETFEKLASKPLAVNDILVEGLERTKPEVVLRELEQAKSAATLEELTTHLLHATQRLQNLDIFSKVDMICDAGPAGEIPTTDVRVRLAEKSTLGLHVGTYVQRGEGSVEGTVKVRNLVGQAEVYELHAARGDKQSQTFTASVLQPRLNGSELELEARVFKNEISQKKQSSFSEHLQGVSAHIRSNHNEVIYEIGMRGVDPSAGASRSVEAHRGMGLKSSLKHSFMADTRTSLHPGAPGLALRTNTELAGLGPTEANLIRYVRGEVTGHCAVAVSPAVSLALTASAGLVVPWGQGWTNQTTSIADRFFIGGPSSLRGFRTFGVGPSDIRRQVGEQTVSSGGLPESSKGPKRDYLGGDLKLTGLAALTFQFPNRLLQGLDCRGQVFVNAGNVMPLNGIYNKDKKDLARSLLEGSRLTAGVGLTFPLSIGTVEVNLCNVLQSRDHDKVKKGVQIGIIPHGF